MKKRIDIFAYSVEPNGISGGETILINTFKRIGNNFEKVTIHTWGPGKSLYLNQGLTNVSYEISKIPVLNNFYLSFILRIIYGIWKGLTFKVKNNKNSYLYPSSDFWPEAIPVILIKLKNPKVKLIANFFLSA